MHREPDPSRRFQAALDASEDAIFVVDRASMRLLDANDSACRLHQLSRDRLLDCDPGELLAAPREDLAAVYDALIAGTPGAEARLEVDVVPPHGPQACFEWRRQARCVDGQWLIVTVVRDITEHKTQQSALREVTEQAQRQFHIFDTALSSISDLTYIYDREGRFVYANKALLDAFGIKAHQLIGKNYRELGFNDTLANRLQQQLEAVFRTGRLVRDETPHTTAAGNRVFYEYVFQPVFGSDGTVELVAGATRDITERKQAEATLLESERRFRFLNALGEVTRAQSDAADIMGSVGRLLGEHMQVSRCAYAEVDTEADLVTMHHAYHQGCPSGEGEHRLSLFGESSVARLKAAQTLVIRDIETEPACQDGLQMFRAIEARALICCPLVKGGRLRAMIAVQQGEPRDWTANEVSLVQEVVERCWATIERARAEHDLRASQERYRRALRSLSAALWEWNVLADLVFYSSRYKDLLGYPARESVEPMASFFDALHPDDAEQARAALQHHLATPGSTYEVEYRLLTRPGDYRWFSAQGEAEWDEQGRPYRMTGSIIDITARKVAEAALKHSEEGLRTLAESMPQLVWIALPDGAHSYFNQKWMEYTGANLDDLYGSGWLDWVHPDDRQRITEGWLQASATGETHQPEYRLRRADGVYRWFLARALPARAADGSIDKWLGTSTDIDDQKTIEQDIRRRAVQQSLIAAFGQKALANSDIDELLNAAVLAAADGLEVRFSRLLQLSPDKGSLLLKCGIGWDPDWVDHQLPDPSDQAGLCHVVESNEPIVVNDYELASEFSPSLLLLGHRIRSAVDVPIAGAAGPYGVLGAYSPEPQRFSADNVHFLRSLANTLATAIDRKAAEDRLTYLAQFDPLTGLPNRTLFLDRLSQGITLAQRNQWRVGAVSIDLDRFKTVNDTLGHAVGDELLSAVAARLQTCLRSADTVGRLGGDEFAFVLTDLAKADDAALVAQKVITALAQPFQLSGVEVYVSASLGMAIYPDDGDDAVVLLKNADTALYLAKERGRNSYQFYLPEMNARTLERLQMETQLRGALERGEFLLHFQPKVNLASGEISGFEALLRWQHPARGLVPPLQFISILEDTGLIIPVGEWVVQTACEQLLRWQAAGVALHPIAVNISARQFLQRDVDTTMGAILRNAGIDPALIEFELTESMLMNDPQEAVRMLKNLRTQGIRLSVDDFGTGYSSLAHLKRFPLDALKIDRAFIRDVTTDPDDASIALAIISLAHSLKLKVVAEGVETEAQLNFLRAHRCDEMQGYYFAKPMPEADCTKALLEGKRLQSAPSP